MVDIKLPPIPQECVDKLDELFPSKCPDPQMGDREIWIEVGKRLAVEFIIAQKKLQDETMIM